MAGTAKKAQNTTNKTKKESLALSSCSKELASALRHASEKAAPILEEFYQSTPLSPQSVHNPADPFDIQKSLLDFFTSLSKHPDEMMTRQLDYWQSWGQIWQNTLMEFTTGKDISEDKSFDRKPDRRFRNTLWDENALYDFIKKSYLLTSETLLKSVRDIEDMDPQTRHKLEFYIQQYIDAVAPSNFILTNPEILETTIKTGGENLVKGLENLLEDIQRGNGRIEISKTDYNAFEPGKNLATTKGCVIYQNELMQLIQYSPTTSEVHAKPLLIIPPWINKYYILDLQEKNSFVKWLVNQGHSVFMISWINPDSRHSEKDFDDYMEQGPMEALEVIQDVTGEPRCNAIGYCLGGTLLASMLAWMHAGDRKIPIASASFLTTLIDFEKAGDLKIFTDDNFISFLKKKMERKGYLEASTIRDTFSMLRSSDLIWSFIINNYMLGKDPMPFDILYWNDDATNMPAKMHLFYLKNMYRDNLLSQPGGLTLKGRKIDLGKIKTPSYFLSTRSDHIAPWRATYAGTQLFSGPLNFTLADSGHIAGVVNPPAAEKYSHFTNSSLPEDPDKWLSGTTEHDGSWWPHWQSWIKTITEKDEKVKAREPGSKKYPCIEKAPGSFVKIRS